MPARGSENILWPGYKLRMARQQRGVPARTFASHLGVGYSSLMAYEAGTRVPPITVAHDIVRLTRGQIRYSDIYPQMLKEFV